MARLINVTNDEIDSEYNLEGYEATDSAGNKLGGVDSVIVDGDSLEPRYVVVDTGGVFHAKQFVVPAGDINEIDDDERQVSFRTVTHGMLESGQYPAYDESWWETADQDAFSAHEREVARAYQPERDDSAAVDYSSDLYRRPAEGARRLELLEERLRATKERFEIGAVTLRKRIIEHTESVTVPMREEHIIIERTAVTGDVTPDNPEIDPNESLEVPVMRDRLNVVKEAVVTTEVTAHKQVTERTEHFEDSVRREQVVVDDPQNVVRDRGKRG